MSEKLKQLCWGVMEICFNLAGGFHLREWPWFFMSLEKTTGLYKEISCANMMNDRFHGCVKPPTRKPGNLGNDNLYHHLEQSQ